MVSYLQGVHSPHIIFSFNNSGSSTSMSILTMGWPVAFDIVCDSTGFPTFYINNGFGLEVHRCDPGIFQLCNNLSPDLQSSSDTSNSKLGLIIGTAIVVPVVVVVIAIVVIGYIFQTMR